MNVLLVVPWDNLGGVCAVVNNVAKHLQSHGHSVSYLLPGRTMSPVVGVTREGFSAVRLNRRRMVATNGSIRSRIAFMVALPLTMFVLVKLLRRLKIDVVNVHFPSSAAISFAILRRLRIVKVVTSVHGADLLPEGVRNPVAQSGILALLSSSDLIVVPSRGFEQALRLAWPELENRPMKVIANGVDPDELGYSSPATETAASPPYILSVLQLVTYKGADVLIRAFAAIAAAYPTLQLELVSDGPNRKDYEQLCTELGLRNRVRFLGVLERPDVASRIRGCTLFVLPSRSNSESFGIAAAEAMALDRPVIVSRIGGLPDLVTDEQTGVLVPPGDVDALAAAMRRLLDDRPLRERLGRNGGERVRSTYLWSTTGAQYEAMFQQVTGRS